MGLFDLFKKKAPEPEEEWVNPIPKVNRDDLPKYVWEMKTTYLDVTDAFNEMVKDYDFLENEDYKAKKKDLLEDYSPGDRVYQYQTEYLDCTVETSGNVLYDDIVIGTIPKSKLSAVLKCYDENRKVFFEIIGGKYKKILDDDIITDSSDYGVKVTYEVKKKKG